MNDAWKKLTKRKEFALVDGWIRTTEVTRDKERPNEYAHPIFMWYWWLNRLTSRMDMLSTWIGLGHGVSACGWTTCPMWTFAPLSPKDKNGNEKSVIAETLKYAIKPEDMIGDESLQAVNWFHEYTRQVFKLRFVASGGALKNALKADDKITDQDMITADQDPKPS